MIPFIKANNVKYWKIFRDLQIHLKNLNWKGLGNTVIHKHLKSFGKNLQKIYQQSYLWAQNFIK